MYNIIISPSNWNETLLWESCVIFIIHDNYAVVVVVLGSSVKKTLCFAIMPFYENLLI